MKSEKERARETIYFRSGAAFGRQRSAALEFVSEHGVEERAIRRVIVSDLRDFVEAERFVESLCVAVVDRSVNPDASVPAFFGVAALRRRDSVPLPSVIFI